MQKLSLTINGMGSQHCVGVVRNILQKQAGVALDDIQIGKAVITLDEARTSKKNVVSAIEKLGYKVQE